MSRPHAIRIVGGSAGGRVLATLPNSKARPTAASVREALANILRPVLTGARVLDLYAGYGCVGLELLSQGAWLATFVEADARRFRILRENIEECGLGERCSARCEKVSVALVTLDEPFDIVYADPPYGTGEAPRALGYLAERADGLVVIEHSAREPLPETSGRLRRTRERRAGETVLSFYEGEAP